MQKLSILYVTDVGYIAMIQLVVIVNSQFATMKDLLPCPYVDDLSLLTDQIDFHLLIEEGRAISLRTPD